MASAAAPAAAGGGAGDKEEDGGAKAISTNYANGRPALRFNADGSGFAYYPSEDDEEPRVAVCVSKVNSYQNKYFFYDNSSQPYKTSMRTFQIPKTLLCAINELVVGHARCRRAPKKDGAVAQVLMTKDGCTLVDGTDGILKSWLWDSSRQNAGTPPRDPIELRLNKYLKFKFVNRKTITVVFKCDPVKMEFDCGEKLRRLDTYIENSTPVPFGELRGKRELQIEPHSLIKRQQEFSATMRHKTILLHPDSNRIHHPELSSVMADLEKHFAPYEAKIAAAEFATKPYNEAGWKEAAFEQTLKEVPKFGKERTDLGATLGEAFDADPEVFEPSKTAGTSRIDRTHSAMSNTLRSTMGAGGGAGAGAGATRGSMGATAKDIEEGFGGATLSGVAQENGRWLTELAVTKKLEQRHPVLERSRQLKDASGRYCIEAPVDNKAPPFVKLDVIGSADFDDFISNGVNPDQLVLVACLREDDNACRNATQLLEHVNGTLASRFPADKDTGESKSPYVIVKFDMAESRFMVKRYGIHTLPMYLMFFNAKLVYAGMLGGAKFRMPKLDRSVNYLLLEPDARSQMAAEKLLRKERFEWDLACTTVNAISHVKRLAENARDAGGAAAAKSRHGDKLTYHSVILVSGDMEPGDVKPLVQIAQRRGGRAPAVTSYGGSRLLGNSLVAVTHPIGTVLPAASMCTLCLAAVHEKKGGRASDVLDAAKEANAAGPTGAEKPWSCPRCAIVQNVQHDLLLGGHASVAIIKPIKVATLHTLAKLWNMLHVARRDEAAKRASGGKAATRGPEYESADGAHMGLTHDDVLKKLAANRSLGQRGKYMPADFKFGLSLSTQDTMYKGVVLNKTPKHGRRAVKA